jgi:hypothetical protein
MNVEYEKGRSYFLLTHPLVSEDDAAVLAIAVGQAVEKKALKQERFIVSMVVGNPNGRAGWRSAQVCGAASGS